MQRRWSRAEADRLVQAFEQSGLGRKEFSAVHGLCVHTLDAWRKRIVQSRIQEEIVPVEIIEGRPKTLGSMRIGNATPSGQVARSFNPTNLSAPSIHVFCGWVGDHESKPSALRRSSYPTHETVILFHGWGTDARQEAKRCQNR
jgi:hypothetical protein